MERRRGGSRAEAVAAVATDATDGYALLLSFLAVLADRSCSSIWDVSTRKQYRKGSGTAGIVRRQKDTVDHVRNIPGRDGDTVFISILNRAFVGMSITLCSATSTVCPLYYCYRTVLYL